MKVRLVRLFLSFGVELLIASLLENNETGAAPLSGDECALLSKEKTLRGLIREMGSVLVAYSGGVDSSYVAFVANSELGSQALCVTGESESLSVHEREGSTRLAQEFGFNREVIRTRELEDANYTTNNPSRCFFCKDELYEKLGDLARERAIEFILDGSTLDDISDYRPGRAAANQHGVRSPLIEAGLDKVAVRELSRRAGLPTWDKPASPCLSSRIAYGIPVTIERLSTVDRGEEILRQMGFREFRVRHHDKLVRLEIARDEMAALLNQEVLDDLAKKFSELGFQYVTLDLQGFRSGAMNEVLKRT